MMQMHDLNISGKRAISFKGEQIAHATNRETTEKTIREWDDVKVYRLDPVWIEEQYQKSLSQYGDRAKRLEPYALGVAKCTTILGDRDFYRVRYPRTLKEALDMVRSLVPQLHREVEEELRLTNSPLPTGHEAGRSPVES